MRMYTQKHIDFAIKIALVCMLFLGAIEDKMAQELLAQLEAGTATFSDVIGFIEARYTHTPTAFKNGQQLNAANENQGSAKIFSFAKLNGLDQAQTLSLFAEHYASVLATPDGTDHQNIRQFMQHGWDGVQFETLALSAK